MGDGPGCEQRAAGRLFTTTDAPAPIPAVGHSPRWPSRCAGPDQARPGSRARRPRRRGRRGAGGSGSRRPPTASVRPTPGGPPPRARRRRPRPARRRPPGAPAWRRPRPRRRRPPADPGTDPTGCVMAPAGIGPAVEEGDHHDHHHDRRRPGRPHPATKPRRCDAASASTMRLVRLEPGRSSDAPFDMKTTR